MDKYLTIVPEDKKRSPKELALQSEMGFDRGYVILNVSALNSGGQPLRDLDLWVNYDAEKLRLKRIESRLQRTKGRRAFLGDLAPGEETTVTYVFDPQETVASKIKGVLSYSDATGERLSVEVEQQPKDMVCPALDSDVANTAKLKRLLTEELPERDRLVLKYPGMVDPSIVHKLANSAMAARSLRYVKDLVSEGPPYESETWYLATSLSRRTRMVLRLSVVDSMKLVELVLASNSRGPINVMQVEFKRALNQLLKASYRSVAGLRVERDDALHERLHARRMLIDRAVEGELGTR